MDPVSQLGLSSDSVQGYNIGEIHRPSSQSAAHTPELLPCGYLVGDSNTINIQLKGTNALSSQRCNYFLFCQSVRSYHIFNIFLLQRKTAHSPLSMI